MTMYFKHIHSCCSYVTHRLSSCYASSHSTPFPHNVMKTLEIISWVLLPLSDSKESTVQLCNMDISLACSSWPYPWDPSCTCTAGNGSAVFISPQQDYLFSDVTMWYIPLWVSFLFKCVCSLLQLCSEYYAEGTQMLVVTGD